MPHTKPGFDNDPTGKDQSVWRSRREYWGAVRQRCYKGKFQQPKPFTENSGDAWGAVYRHRWSHFRERWGKCRAQAQHNGKILEMSVVKQHKFPWFRRCRRRSSEREKNSTEKFTRVIRRTQLRALRRDSSQSDVHECDTAVRRSAKMQKDPNVSPPASQTPSAKTRLARKSRERQPTKRCVKHERELKGSTRCVDWSISAHIWVEACPLTTRHNARSKRETAANVKALREGLTGEKDCAQQNSQAGNCSQRACQRETHRSDRRVISTHEGK